MLETCFPLAGVGVVSLLLPAMAVWVCYVGLHVPARLIVALQWDRKLRLPPLALAHVGLLLALMEAIGRFGPEGPYLLLMPFMALSIWCEWLRHERQLR